MKEARKRTLVKSISWRILATLLTSVIVLLFTGKFSLAIIVGGIDAIATFVLYYFHERMWNMITWGRR